MVNIREGIRAGRKIGKFWRGVEKLRDGEEEGEDRNSQRIFFNYSRSEMREKFNCTRRSPWREEIIKKEREREREEKFRNKLKRL